MVPCGWWAGLTPVRADWRSTSTMPGAVSVMNYLDLLMLVWHVHNLRAFREKVHNKCFKVTATVRIISLK